MIQTYNDIQGQIKQFESSWNEDGQLQKIYGCARFVSVSLRSGGKTSYLIFGRGKGYEGFWQSEEQIPSEIRKKDRFVEYLRKRLSGARLIDIFLDEQDRVIYLDYQKFGKRSRLGLFYNGRKLYLCCHFFNPKKEQMEMFKSWAKGGEFIEDFFDPFMEVGKSPQDKSVKSKSIISISDLIEQEIKDAGTNKELKKRKSFVARKRANIKKDLEKAQKWKELSSWVESCEDFEALGREIKLYGHKIKFKEKAHFKRRDEAFQKVKKLKRGEKILSERLQSLGEEDAKVSEVSKSSLKPIEPVWSSGEADEKITIQKEDAQGYLTIKEDSFVAGVGISAKGNDQLRKLFANKDDWWFHLEGETSSHIIVKAQGKTPSIEVIERVAALMKKYSKIDTKEVNLIYTQVKNLKGIAGVAGSVNYKKEKRVRIYVEDEN